MLGRGLLPTIRSLQYNINVVLCILGSGDFKEVLVKEAKALNVEDRVIFCGNIPYDELHEWTCSADIGISLIEPISFSYELALPNKLFEYCMARIPSIASDLPAIRKVVDAYPIARIIPPDSSPETIAETVKEMSNESNRKAFVDTCEKAAKVFSYDSQEEKIISFTV